MTLENLLVTLRSDKKIFVDLFSNENLLLISFNLPGYESVSAELLAREVKSVELPAINSIKITLKEA